MTMMYRPAENVNLPGKPPQAAKVQHEWDFPGFM